MKIGSEVADLKHVGSMDGIDQVPCREGVSTVLQFRDHSQNTASTRVCRSCSTPDKETQWPYMRGRKWRKDADRASDRALVPGAYHAGMNGKRHSGTPFEKATRHFFVESRPRRLVYVRAILGLA